MTDLRLGGCAAWSERLDKIVEMLDGIKVDRLLDLGCGNGAFGSHIARITRASVVAGVDIDENILKAAKRQGYDAFRLDLNYNNLPFSKSPST